MQSTTLDLSADIIDVRDIIARVEELEQEREGLDIANPEQDAELAAEHCQLTNILAELVGYGGDEQWRGDWYPVTLVRDSHFRAYAEQLADECGYTDEAARDSEKNPLLAYIDWEAWARDVRMDYTAVEIDGVTYWYR